MAKQEKLIALVKNYPIFYDLSNEDYKNVRKKDKIWTEIGKEIGNNGDEAKRKWKNLRDSYAKYIRSSKTKTGQAATKVKKWLWADQMESFRPFLKFAKTVSNVGDTDMDSQYSTEITDGTTNKNPTEFTETTVLSSLNTNEISDLPSEAPYTLSNQQDKETIFPIPPSPSTSLETPKSNPTNKSTKKRKSEPSSSVKDMIAYFERKKNKTGV